MSPRSSPGRRAEPKANRSARKPRCFWRTLFGVRCKNGRPAFWPVCKTHRFRFGVVVFGLAFTVAASFIDLETLAGRVRVWAGSAPNDATAAISRQPSSPLYVTYEELEEKLARITAGTPLNEAGVEQKDRELEEIRLAIEALSQRGNQQVSPDGHPNSDDQVAALKAELEAEREKNRLARERLREGGAEAILDSIAILGESPISFGIIKEGSRSETFGPEENEEFVQRAKATVREGRARDLLAGTWIDSRCRGTPDNCGVLEADPTPSQEGSARFEWHLAPRLEDRVARRLKRFVRERAGVQGVTALTACALYEEAASPVRAVLVFLGQGLDAGPEAGRLALARR